MALKPKRELVGSPVRLEDPRFCRVLAYIHRSLGEETSIGTLAEVAGLSPFHFVRAFKRATGRSPHRYVLERRIARAAELLRSPGRSIAEVAYEVGFCSQSHLTVMFRRFMKTTPAAYRHQAMGLRRASKP